MTQKDSGKKTAWTTDKRLLALVVFAIVLVIVVFVI
jgi:hypothetical protein